MPPFETVIIGAGGRGTSYGTYALKYPQEMVVTAIAEPDEQRRRRMATEHDIDPAQCYTSWQDLVTHERLAPLAINCTMDRIHTDSTLALLDKGYDVLLEKPMSPILEENIRLVQVAEEKKRLLQVCHVLRYSPFWLKLREILQSGVLGKIISVDHRENLVYWHIAHSFVRGNWRQLASSGPMILTKCCHDFDILYWLLQKRVTYLSSFGSLVYFRPDYAPEGATQRCTDGCPVAEDCKYYAPRLYASDINGWPYNALTIKSTVEARLQALRTGPYGRCVYYCDNDVVDHQIVNMELEDGTTVTLTMQGQGNQECRTMRYDGTQATLYAKFTGNDNQISIYHHHTGKIEKIIVENTNEGGHGGGDFGIVRSFLNAAKGKADDNLTTARESLESHLLAFAAEEARLNRTVIDMPEFRDHAEQLTGR